MRLQDFPLEVSQRPQGIRELLGSRVLEHNHARLVVQVCQGESRGRQLVEETLLGAEVVLHGLVIIQVVACQIRKDTPVEIQTADATLVDGVRANLHEGILAFVGNHIRHEAVEGQRVGSRMLRRDRPLVDVVAYGGQ